MFSLLSDLNKFLLNTKKSNKYLNLISRKWFTIKTVKVKITDNQID